MKRFRVKHWHPKIRHSEEWWTVEAPDWATDADVISYLSGGQPFLLDGERWEVEAVEKIK